MSVKHTTKLFECEEKWPDYVFPKKPKTRIIILIGKAGAEYIGCSFQLHLNLRFEFLDSMEPEAFFSCAHKTF